MVLLRPITKTIISTETFGQPAYDAIVDLQGKATNQISHAAVSGALNAATVSTVKTALGSFAIPSAGMWLVGLAVDVNATGSGFGYVSAWISNTNGGNAVGAIVMQSRIYEQGAPGVNVRADATILQAYYVSAPTTLYAVGMTYAGSKAVNGGSYFAWMMYKG
jgi:hypothetical protein